ncbi:DUF202 domain-containing protein [Nostocoides sp.]|uniref:DUF202 domain-containing protein n=1 Tax=Nostocoides sp. TaxID=1917966 RepID=UPI002CF84D9F|nr:DUF202 domain-containing protein [Tetrasphaera sp.]
MAGRVGRHAPWAGDTGLARERTDLSWGRTLLAVMTVTGLFLRWLPEHGAQVVLPVVIGVAAGLGLVRLRHGRRAEVHAGHGDAVGEVVGLTALVMLVGLSALVLITIGIPL